MSEPVYTVIAVTARFIIVVDESGRREKIQSREPALVSKGDILTQAQRDALR